MTGNRTHDRESRVRRLTAKPLSPFGPPSYASERNLLTRQNASYLANEEASTEKVDDKVDNEFDDLYERQQRHSKEEAKTSTDV